MMVIQVSWVMLVMVGKLGNVGNAANEFISGRAAQVHGVHFQETSSIDTEQRNLHIQHNYKSLVTQ